jgi:two-component system cell cycle response regulator
VTAVILIVDDEPSGRDTTFAQLLPERHQLRLAAGGAEAMATLRSEPIDLVVCDVMMPVLDGFALCQAIKADAAGQLVPVILLTALGERDDVVRGLDVGADEFVTKPVEGAVLRAKVRAMLRVRERYLELRGSPVAVAAQRDRRAELVASARLTEREREVLDLLLLGRNH